MRKAMVAGSAAVALVATLFVAAPTLWSQGRPQDENRGRRVVMLDGRGSTIGVSVSDREAGGVLIEDVDEDSPAAKAGIRDGDAIVEFDGERVRSARHFSRLVQETADGRSVKLTLMRDGSRRTVDVTPERGARGFSGDFVLPHLSGDIEREVARGLRALPRDFAFDFNWDPRLPGVPEVGVWPRSRIGAQLSPLTDQLAEYFGASDGVLVSSVEPESVAAKAGLKAGDVITSVNGRSVDAPRDVAQELRSGEPGKDVEIGILRDKKALTLKAQVPQGGRPATRRPPRPA